MERMTAGTTLITLQTFPDGTIKTRLREGNRERERKRRKTEETSKDKGKKCRQECDWGELWSAKTTVSYSEKLLWILSLIFHGKVHMIHCTVYTKCAECIRITSKSVSLSNFRCIPCTEMQESMRARLRESQVTQPSPHIFLHICMRFHAIPRIADLPRNRH